MVDSNVLFIEHPTSLGIIFVLFMAFIVFIAQFYYYRKKRLIQMMRENYIGIIENYRNSEKYMITIYTLIHLLVLIITAVIAIFLYIFYEYENEFWDVIYFFTWIVILFIGEGVFKLIIKRKYYEYYE